MNIHNLTDDRSVLAVVGPSSRALLQSLTQSPLNRESFPQLSVQKIKVVDIEVTALSVSSSGELSFELHHALDQQVALYESLIDAGQRYAVINFGLRALDSMRLEKGWRWSGVDYQLAASVVDAGLTDWVRVEKGDFLGRSAFEQHATKWCGNIPLTLLVDTDGDEVAPWGEEPVLYRGEHIAFTTSGGFGHRIGSAIALASLPSDIQTN